MQKFIEILVIFPDNSPEFTNFQNYLNGNQTDFQLAWGNLYPLKPEFDIKIGEG
ncbi:hypothetical protein ACN4EE_10020 [Geminocystis sp. CENA526]|uniref:hypothetical protein n=1 Tax=Geminocystis sp. CENA526 TaxID=1355871 RepID=UPI003D6EF91B